MKRRSFIKLSGAATSIPAITNIIYGAGNRLNILLLTADDMNYDSIGFTGCPLPGISPNLDKLAKESLEFKNAHIVSPICGPSRGAFHTGRYPHNTGSLGHGIQPTSWWKPQKKIPPVSAYFHDHGYLTGLICKGAGRAIDHVWDFDKGSPETDRGRNPVKYHNLSTEFFNMAKEQNKPFFFNVNMCDPHVPWARQESKVWLDKEKALAKKKGLDINIPDPKTHYNPKEIPVPPFLIDTPEVRKNIAAYFDSVNRMDECTGEILRALKESGMGNNTLVVFISDHGMGVAFAKRSLYYYGTRTPLIFKWPEKIKPGKNNKHVVSVVDLMPTFMEAAGLVPLEGLDGRSIWPIIQGKDIPGWRDMAYSAFNCMNGEEEYWPSRAMTGKRFVYVWNSWVDGKNLGEVVTHGGDGGTDKIALQKKRWGKDWKYGVREEFYDTQNDPGYWKNLINDPEYKQVIDKFRKEMLTEMIRTDDHEQENFKKRREGTSEKFHPDYLKIWKEELEKLKKQIARTDKTSKNYNKFVEQQAELQDKYNKLKSGQIKPDDIKGKSEIEKLQK